MGRKGYLAVVLDKQSHLELSKLANPEHVKIHAHHSTLQFGVDEDDVQLLNRMVIMKTRWKYEDVDCVAITIQYDDEEVTASCDNKYAHITISCGEGVKPFRSHKMIEEAKEVIPIGEVSLIGIVKFVPFDPQPVEYQEQLRRAATREKPVESCCGGIPLVNGKCPSCGDRL